jgi:glycosyltransferase involved in cell wall biosynthesis
MSTGSQGTETTSDGARSLCLCMIVKDEAHTIERCLDSCRELIDYWVICDTGSTDGTQAQIRDVLADIPGELHEHEWIDFAHNRSRLLALAVSVRSIAGAPVALVDHT